MYRNYITQIISFHDNVDIFKMSRSPVAMIAPHWANWLFHPLYTAPSPLIKVSFPPPPPLCFSCQTQPLCPALGTITIQFDGL